MAHIVITSGPTRQYLDPVRFLTNGSSGRMGAALAAAALDLGHRVTIVSGPVNLSYPWEATLVEVVTTQEMLDSTREVFQKADGLIGAAAPCDYMPNRVEPHKMSKTGSALQLSLMETPDIVATLGASKRKKQWVVGFALETEDVRFRALVKMAKKSCDMMVSNCASAMNATDNSVEILSSNGSVLGQITGPKTDVSQKILALIQAHLIERTE